MQPSKAKPRACPHPPPSTLPTPHSHQRAHKRHRCCQRQGWGQKPGLGWSLLAMGRSHHRHYLLPRRGAVTGKVPTHDRRTLPPHSPNPSLPGRQRSRSLWACLGCTGRGLQPPAPAVSQKPPRSPCLVPQVEARVPALASVSKKGASVKDQARDSPSPLRLCLPLLQTHRLGWCEQGAGQSVDDAIESQDVPHDDVTDHNCPWGLWRNSSQAPR